MGPLFCIKKPIEGEVYFEQILITSSYHHHPCLIHMKRCLLQTIIVFSWYHKRSYWNRNKIDFIEACRVTV